MGDNKTGRQTCGRNRQIDRGRERRNTVAPGNRFRCASNLEGEQDDERKEDEVNENRARKKICLRRHLIFLHESFRVFFYPLLFLLLPVLFRLLPIRRWRLAERQVFLPHYTGNICISVYRLNIHEGSGVRKIRKADTGILWTCCPFLPFYALSSPSFFTHPPLIFVSALVCTTASPLPYPMRLTSDSRNS